MAGPRTILAVFAHPDDETFAVAGTLARYRHEGVGVSLLVATDGDAGRTSGIRVADREELARMRRRELLAAAGLLGIDRLFLHGYGDGTLATHPPHPILGDIVAAIRASRPTVILTFGPEGAPNLHADHQAVSRLTTAAFFLASNPTAFPDARGPNAPWAPARLFYFTWPRPAPGAEMQALGTPITCRIMMDEYLELKHRAFAEYRTQQQHRGHFEEKLGPYEDYCLACGVPQPAAEIEDLFAGL